MKKILVLGNCGYVGDYLTDELLRFGYDVTGYDNLLYETRYLKDINFIYGDKRDTEKLSKLAIKFAVVIDLAAIVGDQAVAQDPFLSRDINVYAVKRLLEKFGGKFITMSSCSVYGINNELISESAEPNPISEYGRQKVELEKVIFDSGSPRPLVFRLGTLFGSSGQFARIRLDLVANVLAMKAAIGEKIVLSGGEQYRPTLHVKDAANAIIYGIERDVSGLFNLHESNMQIKDFEKYIRQLNPSVHIELKDIRFEDERNYRVISDAYRSLGWSPRFSVQQGMQEIYDLVQEHRIKDVRDPIYYNVSHLQNIKTSDWIKTF